MNQERLARVVVVVLLVAVTAVSVGAVSDRKWLPNTPAVELHAAMPENGGWSTDVLSARVGEPLELHMVSDDVLHGFAVGQMGWHDIELYPGIPVETKLIFDKPGSYTFYCTRWCGANHWRMRGSIEVTGNDTVDANAMFTTAELTETIAVVPRYVQLNLDIDASHDAENIPEEVPQAQRGALWASLLPDYALEAEFYWRYSPSQLWLRLRAESVFNDLNDNDIWHIVAWVWAKQTTQDAVALGQRIYVQECSACHGENGQGDGVMVRDLMPFSYEHADFGHGLMRPPDFSDPLHILGSPPALLEGKILRGGMGTGMPLYGPIYTESERDALVSYLYTFVLSE